MLGLVIVWVSVGVVCGAGPIAHTQYGAVEGRTMTLKTSGITIDRWYGVPFAKPPIEGLRWKPPVDPDSWTGTRSANKLPNACPQSGTLIRLTHLLWTRFREDCLYLNIYSPHERSGGPFPVMVYLHGGAFFGSANIQYPGHFLAARDVVVVVPNYRLGALGFMSTGDDASPGNFGLMDQIKALQFVQNNIQNFGGDPSKVTIFGQSAGADSVGLMMLIPRARGLFHQAITQSGSEQAMWAVNHPASNPHNYTHQVAAQLNCSRSSTHQMMDCLRKVDHKKIIKADVECTEGFFCLGFTPVVDGPDGLLPEDPWTIRARGDFAKVPLLSGITKDDGSLYTVVFFPESLLGGFNRSEFEGHLRKELIDMFKAHARGREEEVFRALNFFYSPWPYEHVKAENREAINKMVTDGAFGAGMDMQLKSHSQHVKQTYSYILGYRSSKIILVPGWVGVPHALDLPYVFNYPQVRADSAVRKDSGLYTDFIALWDEEDRTWADYIQTLWTNFAKHGNPTPEPVAAPAPNPATTWPPFSKNENNILYLDRQTEVRQDYRQLNFAFWTDYLFTVANSTWLHPPTAHHQLTHYLGTGKKRLTQLPLQKVLDEAITLFLKTGIEL